MFSKITTYLANRITIGGKNQRQQDGRQATIIPLSIANSLEYIDATYSEPSLFTNKKERRIQTYSEPF
jgi:hypothetical protein